jgi:sterol 3beta-glucosyltransferase
LKILIISLGSRGDVQPYVALGIGLQAAGHDVAFCTSASFESFIVERGLAYHYMNDDFVELIRSDTGRKVIDDINGLAGTAKATAKLFKRIKPMFRSALADSWETAKAVEPDALIFGSKGLLAAPIAEKLHIPAMLAMPMPQFVVTAEMPSVGFPGLNIGGWYNRLTYRIVNLVMRLYGRMLRDIRRELLDLDYRSRTIGLFQRTDGRPIPLLHCFSEHVVPRPRDWPDDAYVSGYWFLDRQQGWHPPADLQAFLDVGEATVYVGFGSIAGSNAKRTADTVIEALQRANLRGIIAKGWGGIETGGSGNLPDTIFGIDNVPHDWLFPRMAAVVHHGGAGTTAAGIRAGCPTVICPFFGDQPFWGDRVHKLGVGSRPIPQKKLSVENLTVALKEVTQDESIRRRAQILGEKIRAEDGVGDAVKTIEELALRAR